MRALSCLRAVLLASSLSSIALIPTAASQSASAPHCTSIAKVMLDVGHTPEQPGATSARGVPEFEFNLKLARRVSLELARSGYLVSVLVVHGIGQEQLLNRVAQAKRYSPTLFISIHHDSVQPLFIHEWSFAGRANHYSDEFSGFSIFLSELTPKFAESLAAAQILADELIRQGLRPSLHHAMKIPGEGRKLIDRQRGIYLNDRLAVLKEAFYPALLLEAGVIVNRADEINLQTETMQAQIAQAITQTVSRRFCGTNGSKAPPGLLDGHDSERK